MKTSNLDFQIRVISAERRMLLDRLRDLRELERELRILERKQKKAKERK